MSEPRIVTPQEAQDWRLGIPVNRMGDLLTTVASEPDRIRAAVVKALETAAQSLASRGYPDVADVLWDDIDLIKNGADL